MSFHCVHADIPVLLPSSAHLIQRLQDDELSLEEVAALVQLDPVLTSKLLKVANSAFFGMGGRIASIEEAMMVLGLANTRGFVLAEVLMEHFKQAPWCNLDLKQFWLESLGVAACCHMLAHRTLVPPTLAFSVGLLHQIGVLVLLVQLGEPYQTLWSQSLRGAALVEQEQQQFHFDHAQAGADLLGQWNLPPDIVNAVAEQYWPMQADSPQILVELLRCAHDLGHAVYTEQTVEFKMVHWLHVDLFRLSESNFDQTLKSMRSKYQSLIHLAECK